MLKLPFVLLYTAMTFLAWGIYGILLNWGQIEMGKSYLKPFVGVGFAYFLIAVLGAGAMLGGKKEKGHWSFMGTFYSFIAGSVGALGALGVILALVFGGDPVYVMPLIFGGAPVINTLFTSWLGKTFDKITPLFVIGMILVGIGMVLVLQFKPHSGASKHTDRTKATSAISVPLTPVKLAVVDATSTQASTTGVESPKSVDAKSFSFIKVSLSILMAVICWGTYGPVLHLGQMKMGGSRLRPFICVGLAYFVIAVALPLSMLSLDRAGSVWTWWGMFWSIVAGTAGAIGALGIIMAFNSGGKPIFVMPLVFGFAPVVNTLASLAITKQFTSVGTGFYAALATVIAGAVMVLIFAPKAGHGPVANPEPAPKPLPEPTVESKLASTTPVDTLVVPAPTTPSDSTAASAVASETKPTESP